jgi:hypothetical protein
LKAERDFCCRPLDFDAPLQLRDVIAQVAERDVEMLDPVLVRRVKTVAGGEVEPRILCRIPGIDPGFAVRQRRHRGQGLIDGAGHQGAVDLALHRQPSQLF